MTPDQKNKLIHERVMGLCWHAVKPSIDTYTICVKCQATRGLANPDYSKWEHYGPMIKECMNKEWWSDFAYEWDDRWIGWIREYLFNPLLGSTALAEFVLAHLEYFEER